MRPQLVTWDDLSHADEEFQSICQRIDSGELAPDSEELAKACYPFTEEGVNEAGAKAFLAKYPTGIGELNRRMLGNYCREAGVPLVLANLEIAMSELKKAGLWIYSEPEPEAEAPEVVAKTITTPVVARQVAPPTAAEAKFLATVKDVADDDGRPLTDYQRKIRFAKLKRAAIAQRIANRTHVPKPTIVI